MKKWMIIAIAAALVAALLTGCQGQLASVMGQQTGGPSQSAAETATTTQQESANSAAVLPTPVQPQPAASAAYDNRSRLSVSSTETVKVLPDVAYVTLGVTTHGSSADAAQNANSKIANKMLEAIRALGIKDENIQTSNISLYQDYTDTSRYNMEIDYSVKVTPIENVGKVIDAAIGAGANVTYSLTFDVEDRDTVYMQALEKAMKSVADKAQKMAAAGGLAIDKVQDVQEAGQSNYYYPMAEAAVKTAGDSASMVNVTPGQIEVSASVTATYLLK